MMTHAGVMRAVGFVPTPTLDEVRVPFYLVPAGLYAELHRNPREGVHIDRARQEIVFYKPDEE